MGIPLSERVTGIDFLEEIIKWLSERNGSIFLFGSAPGVAEAAGENMMISYPGLKVVGASDGYFKTEEEDAIVSSINNSGADFLCVALGSPKQELFIKRHKKALKVKAAMGVGGSLDVWAGTVDRAPERWRRGGFEWLYRLIKQPKRIRRAGALPLFLIKVIIERLLKKHK
jgi:N-acetylglucosaminyldiphosphoundecaprenol N-acetyl-beta-D-mannosaminyltransferase